jgi:ubiquinone/menaquinone biosynthesis C-methylase UbiE
MSMDDSLPQLDQRISQYYERTPEDDRLNSGAFLLEALRTRELIERHAPPAPGVILDIGGGAGAYALWLAERGYDVHLVDPVARHVAEAERRSSGHTRQLASCRVGDARSIEFPDGSADGVLLLGPLYHLTAEAERAKALSEAARVLKSGGLLFAAAISRFASTLDGLVRDLFTDAQFVAIAEHDLRDGQHRNRTDRIDYFTTAYFHRPEDLRAEIAAAGLNLVGIYGIEGPGWILPDVEERLTDAGRRENLLHAARLLECEPSMLACSAHLLAVARKS